MVDRCAAADGDVSRSSGGGVWRYAEELLLRFRDGEGEQLGRRYTVDGRGQVEQVLTRARSLRLLLNCSACDLDD